MPINVTLLIAQGKLILADRNRKSNFMQKMSAGQTHNLINHIKCKIEQLNC